MSENLDPRTLNMRKPQFFKCSLYHTSLFPVTVSFQDYSWTKGSSSRKCLRSMLGLELHPISQTREALYLSQYLPGK